MASRKVSASPRQMNDGTPDLLAESVDRLTVELQVLRNVLDDLRSELQYLVRNPDEYRVTEPIERFRVTSVPLDAAAEDFEERVNAVPKETVAELRTEAEATQKEKPGPTSQRRLL